MIKWPLFFLLCILGACTTSRLVKPLPEKKVGVGANLGGPLIDYGDVTIPVPLASLTAAYGLKEHTSIYGSVHTTGLLFGVAYLDLGLVRRVVVPKGYVPGFSVSPLINVGADFYELNAKLWPELDLNAYWDYGKDKNHFIYVGVNNWFELASHLPDSEIGQRHHWLFTPQIGNTWVRPKWRYTFEMKWTAANLNSSYNVGNYKSIGGQGAVGVYVSIMRYF